MSLFMLKSYQVLELELYIETVSECPLYCLASPMKAAFSSSTLTVQLYLLPDLCVK